MKDIPQRRWRDTGAKWQRAKEDRCFGVCFSGDGWLRGASLGGLVVKNSPALHERQEVQVRFLGWDDLLEKEMATHSGILAGKSLGERSLAGYSPWGHRVGYG